MSNDSHKISGVPIDFVFGVMKGMQGVNEADITDRHVLISDLYRYVNGDIHVNKDAIEQALENDPKLNAIYQTILVKQRVFYSEERIAASSVERTAEQRQGDGFLLKIRESNADTEQFYVILEISEQSFKKDNDAVALHATMGSISASSLFPFLHDGKSQIILNKDDRLLKLLRDHQSKISII